MNTAIWLLLKFWVYGKILSELQWRLISGKLSCATQKRLTMRAPDLGYAPRFFGIFLASAVSRFEGESALLPQAGNAHR